MTLVWKLIKYLIETILHKNKTAPSGNISPSNLIKVHICMYSKEILKKSPGLVLLSKGVSDYKQHVVFVVIHKNLNKLFLFFSWKTTRGLQTETPLVSKIKGKFLQFFVAFLTNLNFKYVLHTKWEKKSSGRLFKQDDSYLYNKIQSKF